MEKKLNKGLLELPELHKEGSGESLVINVEDDIEEEEEDPSKEEIRIELIDDLSDCPMPINKNVKFRTIRSGDIPLDYLNGDFSAIDRMDNTSITSTSTTDEMVNSIQETLSLVIEPGSTPVRIYKAPAEDAYTNITITSTTNEMVKSIEETLSLYTSRDSSPVSIYKVPAKLKKVNEDAYTPQSVSIGPIHHGRPELQEMERYKWRSLDRYLKESSKSLSFLVQTARNMEKQVRQCYQEPFDHLSSKEFSEMIMLDGIFVTALLQEIVEVPRKEVDASTTPQASSTLHQMSRNYWVKSEIIRDLMLLENQLPFFVIQKFHNFIGGSPQKLEKSIPQFFSEIGNMTTFSQNTEKPGTAWHRARHLVDFIRDYYKPNHRPKSKGRISYNRSATELHEAGVKFQGVPGYDLFVINFIGCKLEIPIFTIDDYTETLFRNLIAFEQCQHGERKDITSYVIFMDSLIKTTKDVDLLVDCGVIDNNLGNHACVASLFNNLHKETVRPDSEFYFEELCTELNDYSKDYWHQWKAKWFRSKKVLRHNYFNTPWSTLSVIGAVILLVLTLVQTICSIVSVLQSEKSYMRAPN